MNVPQNPATTTGPIPGTAFAIATAGAFRNRMLSAGSGASAVAAAEDHTPPPTPEATTWDILRAFLGDLDIPLNFTPDHFTRLSPEQIALIKAQRRAYDAAKDCERAVEERKRYPSHGIPVTAETNSWVDSTFLAFATSLNVLDDARRVVEDAIRSGSVEDREFETDSDAGCNDNGVADSGVLPGHVGGTAVEDSLVDPVLDMGDGGPGKGVGLGAVAENRTGRVDVVHDASPTADVVGAHSVGEDPAAEDPDRSSAADAAATGRKLGQAISADLDEMLGYAAEQSRLADQRRIAADIRKRYNIPDPATAAARHRHHQRRVLAWAALAGAAGGSATTAALHLISLTGWGW